MNEFKANIPQLLDEVIHSVSLFKPELAIIVAFLMTIIASLFVDKHWKNASFALTLVGLAVSAFLLLTQIEGGTHGFFGMLLIDSFSVYARLIITLSLMICTVFVQQHLQTTISDRRLGDLYSILLAAGLGLNLLT